MADEVINRLCSDYYKNIINKKVPTLCLNTSGLTFREIPEELKGLNAVEYRLLALRFPFMFIHRLGVDKQFGITGGIVNVPNPVTRIFKQIPIDEENLGDIDINWKRQAKNSRPFVSGVVRRARVVRAAKVLIETYLYKKEGITENTLFGE